jgi:hypothetical protein
MIPIGIAVGAFAVAFGGIWYFTYDGRPKCDNAGVIETLKSLATDRLQSSSGKYILDSSSLSPKGLDAMLRSLKNFERPQFVFSAFRDRGPFGRYGINCAAAIKISIAGYDSDFSTTYSAEPTSDRQTMVTARFQPNS